MQTTDTVLMVRPAAFTYDAEAALTNASQHTPLAGETDDTLERAALAEFDGAVARLRAAGVTVIVADDTPEPPKPDAVFPNNWVSFHADGTVVLYPMCVAARRPERRSAVLDAVRAHHHLTRVLDHTALERDGIYVEGTGSILFDHDARLAYASVSPRTHPDAVRQVCGDLGYTPVLFHAEVNGAPPYHTNVLLAIGEDIAVFFPDLLPDAEERSAVCARLSERHTLVALRPDQYDTFAGNMLALDSAAGPLLVMSETAYAGLDHAQRTTLAAHARLVPLAIPTIERIGGGSARCMLAEVFAPKR